MKLQDILFIAVLIVLFFRKDPRLAIISGICALILSIPLFYFWIFFTAERLVWYAAAFFLLGIILHLYRSNRER